MTFNTFLGASLDWTNTGNWSTGAAVANSQDVFFTGLSASINTGLDAHTVTPASLSFFTDYTGNIGNAGTGTGTSGAYLQIGAAITTIGIGGQGTGQGPRRLNLDFGSTSATINVITTTTSAADSGQSPVRLKGSALTINLTGGIISVAASPTETSTITALNIANGGGSTAPQAFIGPGATLTALNQSGGTVTNASTISVPNAAIARNSTLNHIGSGGFGTLTIGSGSTCDYGGRGTVALLQIYGTIDLSGGGGAVTLTNSTFYAGSKFLDPLGRAIFTNPPVLSGCSQKDIVIDLGTGRKW